LYFGAYNSKRVEENLKRIDLFKKNLAILTDSERSAMLFGKIKVDLKSKGKIIEDLDILIASIAIADNWLLQRDAHDFMRFPFNENHNLNIPAPQPLSAVCCIPWHMEYLSGKHTSFST
jgi:tRNA(fMet)-specific endonuclease VapC